MPETPDRLELVLKRQASLDSRMAASNRRIDALIDSISSMTRMFDMRFRDLDRRLDGLEQMVRGYASEQITMANQILSAQQRADQAHRRIDDVEESQPTPD